ncbi:MAG: cytochrome c biogenesis protein CcdA [Nanoarchaeota archaeon]|nr:cytochrome c biogenesis protein CcdA [Nanoarchaeota archaeon]
MKKILIFSIMLALISAGFCAETCFYYFHGIGCPHCTRADPFIEELKQREGVIVGDFEVYQNRSNAELLIQYFDAFNVAQNHRGVPIVFINGAYLVGDESIINNLEQIINSYPEGISCPSLNNESAIGLSSASSGLSEHELTSVSLATIISAGLADSINPCAIAVLLIMLGSLLTLVKDRKKAFFSGLAFITSIYIVYFLFGLGLFSAIQTTGLSSWVYRIIGIFAIIIGLFNIKDYFWYGAGGFVMEIPLSWRPALKKLLKSITSPIGAFFMGFIVCFFELPCTGGPYFFVIGLLAEKATRAAAIPVLLLYNIFFVTPLIIINLLFYYYGNKTLTKADAWKEKNLKRIHLITGIVMIILGLIVLLELF